MPFPAIVEWYGPYNTLAALHQQARVDQWDYGLYMTIGERDVARYIGWTPNGMADRVTNVHHPEHNQLLTDNGNQSFYLGDVFPAFGGAVALNNTGSNAALVLIRALQPELNNPDNYPRPPAGNNCCVSVFSCFYGPHAEQPQNVYPSVDPPPGFPAVVAYNPHAQMNNWLRIDAAVPQWQLLIDNVPDNPDP